MKIKFVKVVRITDHLNWWNNGKVIGKTFEALEVVNDHVKIEHTPSFYGYVPLEVCEINPHLKAI
ncbi:hypothetical protein ABEY43_06675 [Priestia megaterium]